MTTKQVIKDVNDIVTETHKDMHMFMNDIGHMIKENYKAIDNICVSCDYDRKIDSISIEISELKESLEDIKDNISSELEDIKDNIRGSFFDVSLESIAQEQDKLQDDIIDIREKLGEILTILYSLPKNVSIDAKHT